MTRRRGWTRTGQMGDQFMKRKIRLTKKRLKDLNIAVSFDDILYAKFKALNDELHRKYDKLIKHRKRLWRVERLWQDETRESVDADIVEYAEDDQIPCVGTQIENGLMIVCDESGLTKNKYVEIIEYLDVTALRRSS